MIRTSAARLPRLLPVLVAVVAMLLAVLWLFAAFASAHAQTAAPTAAAAEEGYYYTVQVGDSWTSVSKETGVSVRELQAANPQSIRVNRWLRTGERLLIPAAPAPGMTVTPAARATEAAAEESPTAEPVREHIVRAGESWNSIAARYDIPARLLRAANPRSVRANLILYRGERLIIPPPDAVFETPTPEPTEEPTEEPTAEATSEPTEEATEEATEEPTEAATEEPTEEPTAEPTGEPTEEPTEVATEEATEVATEVATEEPTAAATEEPTEEPTATPEPTPTPQTAIGVDCPASFGSYPQVIGQILNTPDQGIEGLRSYLTDCGSATDDGLTVQDINGDGADELLVVYANPNSPEDAPQGDLIIFAFGPEGFSETLRARAGGKVSLLANEDINLDGQIDLVWLDTTCGANTCFDTVNVRSWDGDAWADWTDGNVAMAYAAVVLEDRLEEGQGQEIVLDGGIYGSAGAGPQRSRTETWASLGGAPYVLVDTVYEASNCIYHAVLDANAAFMQLPDTSLLELEELYTRAATDPSLTTCWTRENEEAELRSFALFRLALVAAMQGLPDTAGDLVASISTIYSDTAYAGVGETWLAAYQESGSVADACAVVNDYAAQNPAAYEALADYGFANPTFGPDDVCPVVRSAESPSAAPVAPSSAPTATVPMTGTAPVPPLPQGALPGAGTAPPDQAVAPEQPVAPAETADGCPAALADYAAALPGVLADAGGDVAAVEAWLSECGAFDTERGAVAAADLDGDGVGDLVVLPVLAAGSGGFGPGGTQGAAYVFHGDGSGGYELAFAPDVYGQPELLAVDDLNADGRTDVAWSIVGCSSFCVIEVQIATWDAEAGEYVAAIQPGATLAEGEAFFRALPPDALAQGQELVLSGGVSTTPEGGLAVPHEERWQSVGGAPFRRIGWLYDREAEGNDCMGLRLIEADVLLQASDVLGYEPAVAAYGDIFDPELKACSIFGMDGMQELMLLQGLGSFRLVQAQALSGDETAAQQSVIALQQGQPDGAYTKAAVDWLAEFIESGDAGAACDIVQPILDENELLWQITNHYGYNHPALAAEQVCFRPAAGE